MRTLFIRAFAITLLGLPMIAAADPINVTYDVGDYDPGNGFSASWVHAASGCNSNGLYMCGNPLLAVFGTISGSLDDYGVLTINGGTLNIGGNDHDVISGRLGGEFNWSITIAGFGLFYFEDLDLGAGKPNQFDGNTFILWGQNQVAYYQDCTETNTDCERYGIDLYGVRTVPEPGTLALFGIGLFGLGLMRRRKGALVTAAV